jgi:hypothetical protein
MVIDNRSQGLGCINTDRINGGDECSAYSRRFPHAESATGRCFTFGNLAAELLELQVNILPKKKKKKKKNKLKAFEKGSKGVLGFVT